LAGHKVVSHEDWVEARRRELPWERVEKAYSFDGPKGEETLAELFAGRSQLIVYQFACAIRCAGMTCPETP
jgi:predicted dithiol-disulfide oxidoreductase (DUF899 family)